MITEICQELHNWFDYGFPKYKGNVVIQDGVLDERVTSELGLKNNQYFRIIGSVFNDGVCIKNDSTQLVDEEFTGEVWAMAVPPAFLSLSSDIEAWQAKYSTIDSVNMSPYASESFGGYSYSKSGGGSGSSGSNITWKDAFASRLNAWRKI